MKHPIRWMGTVAAIAIFAAACVVSRPLVVKNSALDFLYARNSAAT